MGGPEAPQESFDVLLAADLRPLGDVQRRLWDVQRRPWSRLEPSDAHRSSHQTGFEAESVLPFESQPCF